MSDVRITIFYFLFVISDLDPWIWVLKFETWGFKEKDVQFTIKPITI